MESIDQIKEMEKSVNQAEQRDIEESDLVKGILAASKKQYKTINIGDMAIRVKIAMSKGQRDKLARMSRELKKTEEAEKADPIIYEALADLCIDPPLTKPAAWEYIDIQTGMAPQVFKMITDELFRSEKAAAGFRPR